MAIPTFGTHTALGVKFHAVCRATYKKTQPTPKMLETGTKATSTSHQTSTLPEAQLAKIQASTSTKTRQEDTDTMLTCYPKNQL